MGIPTKQSRSFKALTTPQDVKDYLMRVLSRTGGKKKADTFLYHYSDLEKVYNIINSGFLWLGSVVSMNDYLEEAYIDDVGKRNQLFYSCFSRSEENLAMYKMYTEEKSGVMMSFSYDDAQRIIDTVSMKNGKKQVFIVRDNKLTEEKVEAEVYWTAVCYKNLHSDQLNAETVSNNKIRKPLESSELAGFVKLCGWEYEKEVRLCAFTDRKLADGEKIAVKLPEDIQIQLVKRPGFVDDIDQKTIARLKRKSISIRSSEYESLVNIKGKAENILPEKLDHNNVIAEFDDKNLKNRKLIEAKVVLTYASRLNGSIKKIRTNRSFNYIVGDKFPLKRDFSSREEAKWEAIIQLLLDNRWILQTITDDDCIEYKVTYEGYNESDDFGKMNDINTDQPPKETIELLCQKSSFDTKKSQNISKRAEKTLEWVVSLARECERLSLLADKSVSPADPRNRIDNYNIYMQAKSEMVGHYVVEKALHQEIFDIIGYGHFLEDIDSFIEDIDEMVTTFLHEQDTTEALELNNTAFQKIKNLMEKVQKKLARLI